MRRSLRYSPTARRGFTLVEMLVAAALSIMIMAIMATAFTIALDTLSQLKSVATIAEDLRSAETIMLRDLKAQHLEDETGAVVRVSDSQVSNGSWNGNGKGGFLRLRQGSSLRQSTSTPGGLPNATYPTYPSYAPPNYPYLLEGLDSDGTPSYRATDHSLHFTVKLSGKTPQDVFSASPPPGMPIMPSLVDQNPDVTQFVGKWAEVAYFMKPTIGAQQTKTDNGLPGITLYTLYRRQRILSPVDTTFAPVASPPAFYASYPECSLVIPAAPPNTVYMNTPPSIANPGNRLDLNQASTSLPSMPFGSAGYGTDVLLTNVISFQVRLLVDPVPTPFANDATNPTTPAPANATIAAWQYDTAAPVPPGGGKLKPRAVQIKLRVYEPKNRLTRQITITQDL